MTVDQDGLFCPPQLLPVTTSSDPMQLFSDYPGRLFQAIANQSFLRLVGGLFCLFSVVVLHFLCFLLRRIKQLGLAVRVIYNLSNKCMLGLVPKISLFQQHSSSRAVSTEVVIPPSSSAVIGSCLLRKSPSSNLPQMFPLHNHGVIRINKLM